MPEFYVIHTGERRNVPERISLREDFFNDGAVAIDLQARVISTESTEDIIGQYIIYAHVYDQQVKLYGRDRKAAEETVRICKDRGVLKEYLEAHEKEVVNSMIMLFEQEEAVKRYGNRRAAEALARGHDKGLAKGLAEGRNEGRAEGRIATYAEMVADGTLTAEKLRMTVEDFNRAVEALPTAAY